MPNKIEAAGAKALSAADAEPLGSDIIHSVINPIERLSGAIHVYVPTSGRLVASLPTGSLHWQSPIVAGGRVAMPLGDANDHATSGQLIIFHP